MSSRPNACCDKGERREQRRRGQVVAHPAVVAAPRAHGVEALAEVDREVGALVVAVVVSVPFQEEERRVCVCAACCVCAQEERGRWWAGSGGGAAACRTTTELAEATAPCLSLPMQRCLSISGGSHHQRVAHGDDDLVRVAPVPALHVGAHAVAPRRRVLQLLRREERHAADLPVVLLHLGRVWGARRATRGQEKAKPPLSTIQRSGALCQGKGRGLVDNMIQRVFQV